LPQENTHKIAIDLKREWKTAIKWRKWGSTMTL
jgi:hypothetical protein